MSEHPRTTHEDTSAESSAPAQALPENAPVVAMDIGIGKKYEQVDFDYEAFAREAERQGMSADKQRSLTINVKAKPYLQGVAVYRPSKESIDVALNPKANASLRHEMQHASDHENGSWKSEDTRRGIGNLGKAVLLPTVVAGMAISGPALAGSELAQRAMEGPYQTVAAAVGAAAVFGYLMHPDERRARRAERESDIQILHTTKRSY